MKLFPQSTGGVAHRWFGRLLLVSVVLVSACGDDQMDIPTTLERAESLAAQAKHSAAILELKALLQEYPDAVEARIALGDLYLRISDGTSAEKEFESAIARGADRAALEPKIVSALLQRSDAEAALPRAQALVDADPSAEHLALLGDAKLGSGDPVSALALYDRAHEADPTNVRALLGVAVLAAARRDYDEARARAAEAIKQAPLYAMAHRTAGDIEFRSGNHEAALAAYQESARLNPTLLPLQIEPIRTLLALGRIDEAETLISNLKQRFGGHLALTFYSAVARYQQEDFAAATDMFREVLSVAPNHARSQFFLGALMFREGRYAQAVEQLSLFLRQIPTYIPARKLLAASQIKLDKASEALGTLDGVGEDAKDAQVQALRASALARGGQIGRSIEALERAIEADPDTEAYRATLSITRVLGGDSTELLDLVSPDAELGDMSLSEKMVGVYALLNRDQFQDALMLAERLGAEHPDNAAIVNAIALAHIGLEDHAATRRELTRAHEMEPQNLGVLRNLALFEYGQGEVDKAREYLKKIRLLDSENVFAATLDGQIAARGNDLETAIAAYEAARKASPSAIDARARLARIYFERKQYPEAIAVADEIIQVNNTQPEALLILGHSLLESGRTDDAAAVSKRTLELYPEAAAAQFFAAKVALAQDDPDRAAGLVTAALKSDPDNPEGLALRTRVQVAQGDHAAASASLQQLQAQESDSSRALEIAGDLAFARGEFAAAADKYAVALKESRTGRLAVKHHRALREAGDTDQAITVMNDYLAANPDFLQAHLELGALHIKAENNDAAIGAYEAFLAASPDNAVVMNNLAELKIARGDADGTGMAKAAYALAPDNPYIQDTYGWALLRGGEVERGLKLLQSAAAGLPDNGEVAYHLAVARSRTRDRAGAVRELERALSLGAFASRPQAEKLLASLKP